MLKYFNNFFNFKNDKDDDCENENILNYLDTNPTDTMFNPVENKIYFLENLDLYHYNSKYDCSLTIKFIKDKKEIDTINLKGKYYEKNNDFYSHYIFNYLPKFNAGKIKFVMNILKGNELIDNDWLTFNFTMNNVSNERNKNITFNSNNHKILLKIAIKNNNYEFREIFIFRLIK